MMHKILLSSEIKTNYRIPARKLDVVLINKKKITSHLADCPVPNDQSKKINKKYKLDKYLDLVKELKNLWNMKLTVIPMIVGTLGTVLKGLEKRQVELKIRGIIDTSLVTALLRLPKNTQKRLI